MEITSPPYPRHNCNAEKLHAQLIELYRWVEDNRFWAEDNAARLEAPIKPFLPDLSSTLSYKVEPFKELAVELLAKNLNALRTIRQRYDEIVRNYEEVQLWDSDACVYLRLQLFQSAATYLTCAFLDGEKREAKMRQLFPAGQIAVTDVTAFFNNLAQGQNPNAISDQDMDRLFNGDSNDNPEAPI
jgi:hypothetical protein